MTRQLQVDAGVIDNVSTRLLSAGEHAASALERLRAGLDARGTCWGRSDEFARNFAKEYLPGRDEVVDSTADLVRFLTDLGTRLRVARKVFAVTEFDNS